LPSQEDRRQEVVSAERHAVDVAVKLRQSSSAEADQRMELPIPFVVGLALNTYYYDDDDDDLSNAAVSA